MLANIYQPQTVVERIRLAAHSGGNFFIYLSINFEVQPVEVCSGLRFMHRDRQNLLPYHLPQLLCKCSRIERLEIHVNTNLRFQPD